MEMDMSINTEFLLASIIKENKNNTNLGLEMSLERYSETVTWQTWGIRITEIPGWRNPESARIWIRGVHENENDITRSEMVLARWNCLKTYMILHKGVKESRKEIIRIMFGRPENSKVVIPRWADSTIGQVTARDIFGEFSGFSTQDYKNMVLNAYNYLFKTATRFDAMKDEVRSFLK